MSIHYKFKNMRDFDVIKLDTVYISAADLKSTIIRDKKLGGSELQIENTETGHTYPDDEMIPKNTYVTVMRLPSTKRSRYQPYPTSRFSANASGSTNNHNMHNNGNSNNANNSNNRNNAASGRVPPPSITSLATSSETCREALEIVSKKNMTEEEKIKQIHSQSTRDFEPSRYARGGRGGGYRGGNPPPHYLCRKCGIRGHFISDCKWNYQQKVKRPSGIPREFLMTVDSKEKGALMMPSGEYAVPIIDHIAYSNPKVEKAPFFEGDEADGKSD